MSLKHPTMIEKEQCSTSIHFQFFATAFLIGVRVVSFGKRQEGSSDRDCKVSIWLVSCSLEDSTWLILPVVICLSQRLSHACLSITVILGNCEWLIKSVIVYLMVPYYSDNRSNSRANTCVNPDFGRDVFIRLKTNPSGPLVIHNNWTNRMGLPRRCFIQISALSRFDGSIEDYHASNG